MRFPFRFYGRNPTDWKGYWQLSVQFQSEPKEDDLVMMAKDFALMCAHSVVDVEESGWKFSGTFAEVAVALRWRGERSALASLAEFFRMLHHTLPIEDVVNLVAVESTGPWDRWSLAQKAPDARPPRDSLTPSEVFEGAKREALARQKNAKVVRELQKQKGGVRLVESELDKSALDSGKLEWPSDVLEAFETPDPPTHRIRTRRTSGERKREGYHPVERGVHHEYPVAVAHDEEGYPLHYAALDESQDESQGESKGAGKIVELPLQPESKATVNAAPALCGEHLFVCTLCRVYRREGDALVSFWKPNHNHGQVLNIFALGEERLLVVTEKKLVVLSALVPDGEVIVERANAGSARYAVISTTMAEDAALIASGPYGKAKSLSLLVAGEFKKVASVPKELNAWTVQGELVFRHGENVYRVSGVAEAAAAFHKKAKAKASKKKSPKRASNKPAKPYFEPVGLDDVPKEHELNPPPHGGSPGFPRDARLLYSDARVVGLARSERKHSTTVNRVFVREGEGPVEERSSWFEHIDLFYIDDADLAPGGEVLDVASGYVAWRVDLSTGATETVWTERSTDVGKAVAIRYVGPVRALLLCEKGIVMLEKSGEEWGMVHRVKVSKCKALVYDADNHLAAVHAMGSTRFVLFAVLRKKFKKLMDDKERSITKMVGGGGMLFVSSKDEAWMLGGAEDAAAFEVKKDK